MYGANTRRFFQSIQGGIIWMFVKRLWSSPAAVMSLGWERHLWGICDSFRVDDPCAEADVGRTARLCERKLDVLQTSFTVPSFMMTSSRMVELEKTPFKMASGIGSPTYTSMGAQPTTFQPYTITRVTKFMLAIWYLLMIFFNIKQHNISR